MNTFARLSIAAFLLLSVACTDEAGQDNRLPEGEEGQRREVLLTIKNKLTVPQAGTKAAGAPAGTPAGTTTKAAGTTKADTPIATAEENYIRSLDVYVFGSEKEDGDYTFQELFYYRNNAAVVPGDWAHEIDLTAVGGSDNATTALMKLTKGLYVKIYCVANREQLYSTAADGTAALYTDFQPLAQSAPGQDNNTVRAGIPTETDFLRLHTKPIDPAATNPTEDDILVTPLPMAGAYTTALDLTDFSVSARTQVGFKLTRTVSRFDIANDAAKSKFTITGVSMAQARPGASFFPIRVLGTLPTAADGELITTPTRAFTGDKANKGLQTGAFYSYASPTEDAGYLILKGTYAVNQSENQEVSYQIPFKPANDAEGGFLEVTHNHRYMIAITKADAFRLDFTMMVADWADDGSIDDYTPGGDNNTGTTATVDLTGDQTNLVTYDEATRQISMPISSIAQFDVTAPIGYTLTKKYIGGPAAQRYDWLEVSAPVDATKAATAQKYSFSLKSGYAEAEYPEAVVEVKNENNGDTRLFKVVPNPITPIIKSGTTYTLAAGADTAIPSINIEVSSTGGSAISGPDWLTYDKVGSDATVTTYRVSLDPNKQGITFPEDLPADQTISLVNKQGGMLTADVTVSFTDAVRGDASLLGYDAIEKEADNSDSYRVAATGKTISVAAYSMFKNPNMTIATAYDSQYGTNKSWLPTPATASKTESASNRRKFTYNIAIPASSGTDAAYQLHKGTVTVKDGSTEVKTYTVWRGASNTPYLTGNATNPYYTAIKRGTNWWAPVNCGAKHVALNGMADTDGIGNIYQWGREDETNFGGGTIVGTTSNSTPNNNKFYTPSGGTYEWLSTRNDALWKNGVNDPCPEGYRVPTIADLNTWINGDFSGGLLKIKADSGYPDLVLPAAGNRICSAGGEYGRGTNGYYWSSSVSGSNASYVTFSSATVVADTYYRAQGFSLRCIRK